MMSWLHKEQQVDNFKLQQRTVSPFKQELVPDIYVPSIFRLMSRAVDILCHFHYLHTG